MRFCPQCGRESLDGSGKAYVCRECGFTLYLNAAASVGAIIECDGSILATVRAHDPGAGGLDLPGGFVDHGETAEQALRRELEEELGLTGFKPTYFGTYPNVYPYKSVTYHTLDLIFVVRLPATPALSASDDVVAIRWIKKTQVQLEQFPFVSIRAVLSDYLKTI